ncbi:class I SAM-dependent methyltransferase [Chitinimonas sp. BJB300]|uniref:class I SAM-dependent methyltransferase n=1 Tax=Chitinimonas sp. BJB300 TaxID=1559339 RepID=UPI000C0D0DA7|nr:class I SAM-dependent methyltransferase [Chitinimonas sp. BJB300]PHV12480.1 methyltransferase type 11 [Chitinimonas sp. BJB300]TSJ89131.1 class I SAM-dependent methyltransferase [Chitinimonas sp. BJB300]
MSENKQALIDWKTDAWKDANMVSWYSKRMFENTGTNQLKHQLEMRYIERYATGKRVLDVGIGTGRGSIPLAQRGMDVTGIDSSQAMLDETRRLAGDAPMTLLPGDVARLPLPDADFDFLLSLNVVVHFPHWRTILQEWDRVLKPGGRILFDIHSLDHLEAVYGAGEATQRMVAEGEAAFGSYMSLARAHEIVAWADDNGYCVEAITAVGGFVVSTRNHWLNNIETKHWWNRLLGWMTSDPKLFEFALWLETEVVWQLPTTATGRYMVVLDKKPDPAGNAAWLAAQEQLNGLWRAGDIAQTLPAFPEQKVERLQTMLIHPRNTYLLFELLKVVRTHFPGISLKDYLPQGISELFEDWQLQEEIDLYALRVAGEWRRSGDFGAKFEHAGVPFGPGMEYNMMRDILVDYLNIFAQGEQP